MTHRLQLAAVILFTTFTAVALVVTGLDAQSSPTAKTAKSAAPAATISAAVCPVVYQLDDSPTRHGYHYIFYGNAFFINRDGYLLTAAHVLSEFRDGGQPSILLSRPYAPPRLVKVTVIATDVVHDVAILRATPNPFDAGYTVAALPLADGNLSDGRPAAGDPLAIQALRPAHAKDPETFELPIPESYSATTLTYRAVNLDPAAINAHSSTPVLAAAQLTDIFLFSHEVIRGQSGAPVTSPRTLQVVGLIEGRWLHPTSGSPAGSAVPGRAADAPSRPTAAATTASSQKSAAPTTVAATGLNLTQGAAVPIAYAKSLLQKNHIPWTTAPPL
jgi:Trypsin-like peptidase domain